MTRWLALLALLLLALPAGAATHTLMVDVATFGWTPASGPVDHYEAVVNGAATELPPGQAFVDVARPYGAWFAVTVRAVDAAGTRGPDSDLSEAYRLAPPAWDGDGDGRITPVDYVETASACEQFEGGLFAEVYLRRVCPSGEVKATCP